MAWTKMRRRNGGVRYTGYYRDADGNERSAGTASTKKLALKVAEDEEAKVRLGMWRDPGLGLVTLGEYFAEWVEDRDMELNTRLTYESHYRRAIAPTFADVALADISIERVQKWVAAQRKAGTKPSTIKARLKSLQTILAARTGKSALRDGKIVTNPCYGVSVPYEPEREVTIFDPDETDVILSAMDEWYRALVVTWLETGLRWGELQGLQLGDLDESNVLRVNRTIIEVGMKYSDNGTRFKVKHYPKTRKRRRLRLSAEVATLVRALAETRGLSEGDRLFAMWERTDLGRVVKRIEAFPNGLPISRNHFGDVWERTLKAAGVAYRRPYDLRATNISWMIAGGADLAVVMQRSGHTQIQTVRRYMAALSGADETALEALAAVRERYDNVRRLNGRSA